MLLAREQWLNSIGDCSSIDDIARAMMYDDCDYFLYLLRDKIKERIASIIDCHVNQVEVLPPGNEFPLPKAAGVYVSFDDSNGMKWVYVGQSQNVKNRIRSGHHGYGLPVVFVEVPEYENRIAIESTLISHLNPQRNIQGK